MSLAVWLPLNGDLHNQGLLPITITEHGNMTISNSGKIGKCYTFDGNDDYLSLAGLNFSGLSEFSFSFWCKPLKNSLFGIFQIKSGGTVALQFATATSFTFRDSEHSSLTGVSFNTPVAGEWAHYAFIYNKGSWSVYKNGIQDGSGFTATQEATFYPSSTTVFIGYRRTSSGDRYFSGDLNDFRIYDHALSKKEVQELARGLILHYKLNEPGVNLLLSTPKSHNSGAYLAYQLNLKNNLEVGKTYTIQLYNVNISHTGKTNDQIKLAIYWGGGYVALKTLTNENFVNGHSDYLMKTFTITQAMKDTHSSTNNAWLEIYNSPPSANGTRNLEIGSWKLEEGFSPTQNSEYSSTEYDVSGYGNNGEKVGSVLSNSNSARYLSSTTFDGNESGIKIYKDFSNLINSEFTFSFWIKSQDLNARSVYFGNYNNSPAFTIEKDTNNLIRIYWNGSPDLHLANTTVPDSVWCHIGIVKTLNSEIKVYINGELKKTQTASFSNLTFANPWWIGRDTRTGTTCYKGNISDFRIYYTALNEDTIKELYQIPVSIDSSGNVFSRELVEL